jgi:hypothetical protein
MSVTEWGTAFHNKDDFGNPLPADELPLVKTLKKPVAVPQNILD